MNGRIYDPVLKGFMSPDNFLQDPHNSQNFNRYAYCYNNPLMYTDQSGEWVVAESALLGAAIIGAIIGGVTYTGMSLYQGNFTWMGLIKSVGIGAVSGAITSGIGDLAEALFPNATCTGMTAATSTQVALSAIGKAGFQAIMHGYSQGFIAGVSGGDFFQGFWSAAVSSVVSSATGGLNAATGLSGTAGDISTMFFGTVSGGLTSKLTGGNFWEGAAIGLTVSGLNHTFHQISKPFEFKDDTVEELVSKLQQEKKGTVLTGKEIKAKYGIKQNVQRAISEVKVLGGGKYDVTWKNKMLINSGTVLRVKDGELTVKSLSISNKNGYSLSGSAISAVIDGVKFPKLFLDGNYIYGVKKNNTLTDGYGF